MRDNLWEEKPKEKDKRRNWHVAVPITQKNNDLNMDIDLEAKLQEDETEL